MRADASALWREKPLAAAAAEAACLALGVGFTALLFSGLTRLGETALPPSEELPVFTMVSVPFETPPPRPVDSTPVTRSPVPFAGLEIAASDSPVRVAVVPPDLSVLIPAVTAAPVARIEAARLHTEFKPRTEREGDFSRIFQQHEVDQRPRVLSRPTPSIPGVVRNNADVLRTNFLILVDLQGKPRDVRILQSSGNKYFDNIISQDIRERWIFTPAVKNGRKVRCLVQQSVSVTWSAGSLFDP